MKDAAAILLAAGRSRRMGKFKPLLAFGETTVIESCLKNLHDAGLEETVVVIGHRGDEIQAHLGDRQIKFAVNPDPDSAMSVSIACGVAAVSSGAKALVIGLVDYPAVESATIKAICEAWADGAKLVQPEYEGRGGHPVLIDLAYREELLRLDPTRGLRGLFDAHRAEVRRLPVSSPYVARDMDTWEDYARLHQDVFGGPAVG